ncbi:MAG: energy transducer TonB [Desulfomonile tiedjei]|uniref:Energy transducer TonB n=1 Tax=Desulfomonile tiedjei TaxID=2358 RepID=A0A9D6V6B6_9BACT|nr:energy transducer TonB [Desulfomonile tiedjei]
MKKSIIIGLALSFGLLTAMLALAQPDEIVVDRSNRNKVFNDYTLLTRDFIQRAWTTPVSISEPGPLKGRISIEYSIASNGSVRSVELVKGSGNWDMDRSLVDAIRSAAPYPAFPDEIQARSILIRANFVVADLPTVPIIVANHELGDGPRPVETEPDRSPKKFNWGAPAGTADLKTPNSEDREPAPASPKKYQWGLER